MVRAHRVGEEVRLRVRRGTSTRTIEVATVADPDTKVPILGLTLAVAPASPCRLPFPVSVDTGEIGGPSAGLAFTLALLDALSPGDLSGSQRVVATGTIDVDENVGAVGAIRQKAVAARAAGATLFLLPRSQSEDEIAAAREIGGSVMRVVTVATLQDALDTLADNGGSALL